MEEKQKQVPYLYITEQGKKDNETIVRALKLPVSVIVHINENGAACVELKESLENDKSKFVCEFQAMPTVKIPGNLLLVAEKMKIEKVISIAVSGWIAIFLRDGVFCTDSKKETFVHSFDLRDVSKRLSENLDDVYSKFIL